MQQADRDRAPQSGAEQPFLSDIKEIRRRAREHIQAGAVTPSYDANREVVLRLLNEALATELVCILRYRRHYFMADGVLAEAIKQEFLVHAQEEQAHADQIAERIVQLGGAPDFNPEGLAMRSAAEYRDVIVAYRNGQPIKLREIANVIDAVENDKTANLYNNERSIVLAIYKQPSANTVDIVDSIYQRDRKSTRLNSSH